MAVDENAILNDMSSGLRIEVSKYLISEMMEDVMPFCDMSPLQWARILPMLQPCIFAAGEVLCRQVT